MFKLSLRIPQLIRISSYYPVSGLYGSKNVIGSHNCGCVVSSRSVATTSASQYIKGLIDNGKWGLQSALRKLGIFDFSRSSVKWLIINYTDSQSSPHVFGCSKQPSSDSEEGGFERPKTFIERLRRNGYYIYDEIADNLDYKYFFEKFNMPDTFNSWFLVMELHVWMVLVRLMAEAEEGRFVRNMIIEAMWEDIRQKAGLLGSENTMKARAQIKVISEEFQAALLSYDEGLLSSDIVLAGALWRRFFSRECNDPELVEALVRYIRKQVRHFDSLTRDDVLLTRRYEWFPIEDKKIAR